MIDKEQQMKKLLSAAANKLEKALKLGKEINPDAEGFISGEGFGVMLCVLLEKTAEYGRGDSHKVSAKTYDWDCGAW
jgi:hypothetical protein